MNFRSSLYKLWKTLSEKNLRKHYREHYKIELNHFDSYKHKKKPALIKKEMKILHKYWGCYPFQYIRYGMYKKSCTLSMEEMKDYIPNFFAYYLFFPRYYKDYGVISEDKELTYRVFESYKISQPTLLLQYKNALFYDQHKNIITDEDVDKIIVSSKSEKLFLKPTLGLGGKGIIVFNKKIKFKDYQGNNCDAAYIRKTLKNNENYILQEGIHQHTELNRIYPNAVNTFRIMTKLSNGEAQILFAMLRMGQGGNQLDNASQQGLVCKIDINSGQFGSLGYSGLGRTLNSHPDSNFVFKGYSFPFWKEIREFVLTATQKMETIGFIGWDIAYAVNGPVAIEMNAAAGLEYLQDCHGGVRKSYGIENPKKYWYKSNYVVKDL